MSDNPKNECNGFSMNDSEAIGVSPIASGSRIDLHINNYPETGEPELLSLKDINMAIQGLDLLVTHHNEIGVEISDLGDVVDLSKRLIAVSDKWSKKISIPFHIQKNAQEIRGLGQRV